VAAHQAETLQIYGNDYATSDGTCIRDFIHVLDLAEAHLLALKKIDETPGCLAYNVGTGRGHSVAEVINVAMEVTKKMIPIEYGPRRPGDPEALVADITKIRQELGFNPKFSELETILLTAWTWHQKLLQDQSSKVAA
jgi:UDP-glucose 4-epimerase